MSATKPRTPPLCPALSQLLLTVLLCLILSPSSNAGASLPTPLEEQMAPLQQQQQQQQQQPQLVPESQLQEALQATAQDGLVIVATVSFAMLGLFHNWRCSLAEAGVSTPVLVYAQDLRTHRHVRAAGLASVLSRAALSSSDDLSLRAFKTPAYMELMRDRLTFLLSILLRGYDVLTVDVDAVWRTNPIAYIRRSADMSAPQELAVSNLTTAQGTPTAATIQGRELCACFLYLRSTSRTVSLLQAALPLLHEPRFSGNEQKVVSYLLLPDNASGRPWEGMDMDWLPKPEFPSGREYFGLHVHREPGYDRQQKQRVAVVHNNWVVSSRKRQRFQAHGMWYLTRASVRGRAVLRCSARHRTARSW